MRDIRSSAFPSCDGSTIQQPVLQSAEEWEGSNNDMHLEHELHKLNTSYNPTSTFEPTHMTEGMMTHAHMAALAFQHIEYGPITPEMAFIGS